MISTKLPPSVEVLIEAAGCAPSADNSQPWCFDWDGHLLTGRVTRRGGFPVDYHATALAVGAAAENLASALACLGADQSSWHFAAPSADGIFAQGPLAVGERVASLAEPPLWKRRHTNRLPYRQEIGPEVWSDLAACRVGEVAIHPIRATGIKQAARWVRQASEVRFQTREVNEWFAASLRYGNASQDWKEGLNVRTLALPPGGVSLLRLMSSWERMRWLNRLSVYKLLAAIEALNFQKAPLVVAVVGPAGKASAFDAGRCLQRVWLRMTELGLSGHPYYVVTDLLQRLESGAVPAQCVADSLELREEIRREYGQENTLHCLLRVGKPTGEVQVAGRLPISEIICSPI